MSLVHLPIRIAGQILSVPTAADLPTICIPPGSIRYIEDTATLAVWDGTTWGFNIDALTVNDLIVNNVAFINANVVEIGDNIVILNNDVVGAPTEDAGIEVERGTEDNAQLLFNETYNWWEFGTVAGRKPVGVLKDYNYAENIAVSSTTSATFQTKVTLNTQVYAGGTYLVFWSAEVGTNQGNNRTGEYRLLVNGVTTNEARQSGTDNDYVFASGMARHVANADQLIDIILQFRSVGAGNANIRNAKVSIWRAS